MALALTISILWLFLASPIHTANVKDLAIQKFEDYLKHNNQTNSIRRSVFDDPNYLECGKCYQLQSYLNKLSHHLLDIYLASLGVIQYMICYKNSISVQTCCRDRCFVNAVVYVDRFAKAHNIGLSHKNAQRLIATSLFIAIRSSGKHRISNKMYSEISNITLKGISNI